ncbi:MAG TPA: helix-turn-helix transcriptional regulator [Clostridia bacterium]|nr:helix-turn-helix transcriptional regulator [Clostridia bacterium]HPK16989.1 helix-turn-helix transcriptional regulator [Clostridia bacterium]
MAVIRNETDSLGVILKNEREAKNYSRELIADRVKISVRYLTAIENEGRKPSYKVLFRLIRSIGISADLIFYPEERNSDTDGAQLVRLIHQCDVRDRKVVLAVVEALLADKKD